LTPHIFKVLLDLQVFDLRYNNLFSSIPADICKLTKLTHIHLHCNGLSGPIPNMIGNLSQLLVLDVRNNQLVGTLPPSITKLKCLNVLGLTSNLFAFDYKVDDVKSLLPGCRSISV